MVAVPPAQLVHLSSSGAQSQNACVWQASPPRGMRGGPLPLPVWDLGPCGGAGSDERHPMPARGPGRGRAAAGMSSLPLILMFEGTLLLSGADTHSLLFVKFASLLCKNTVVTENGEEKNIQTYSHLPRIEGFTPNRRFKN